MADGLVGQATGDAFMSVKVIRQNGTIEEVVGVPIEVDEEHTKLLMEYQQLIKRAQEIETILFGYPISGV